MGAVQPWVVVMGASVDHPHPVELSSVVVVEGFFFPVSALAVNPKDN